MKYGIFTTNRDFAYKLIQSYIKGYDNTLTTKIISNRNLIQAKLTNGTEYRWYHPSENLRGISVDVALIDIGTCPLDLIQNVIIPCSTNCCEAIFDEYTKYDLDTLIDRLIKIKAIKGNLTDIGIFDGEYGWQNIMGIMVCKDGSLDLVLPV